VHGLDKNRAVRLPLHAALVDAGFNVLSFDLRGHGESDKVPVGAGYFETDDLRGAIDYAVDQRDVAPGTLALVGRSFGAAIALMVGHAEPAVVAVYADSSFSSLSEVLIDEVAARTPFPRWFAGLLRPGIVVAGRIKGIEINDVRPIDAIARYEWPLGMSHCLADDRIPVAQSHALRGEAEGPVWYNLFPRCEHAEAYSEFPEQYTAIMLDYLQFSFGIPLPDATAAPTP